MSLVAARPRSAPTSGDDRRPSATANGRAEPLLSSTNWSRTNPPLHATNLGSSPDELNVSTDNSNNSDHTVETRTSGPSEDDPWFRKSLLTLDGGGVRGYSSLLILRALFKEIETIENSHDHQASHSAHPLAERCRATVRPERLQRTGTHPFTVNGDRCSTHYLPCHYFDYIAGTSTGGLIAIMLGRLSMTIEECIDTYEILADRIFGNPRLFHIRRPPWIPRDKYDHRPLEEVIREIVRERSPWGKTNTLFRQPNEDMCRTIVVAWQKLNMGIRVPHLFRSYTHPRSVPENILERNPGQPEDYQIWQVGRATSAAPLYFKAIKLEDDETSEYIDGGFGANNPAEEAWRSVKQLSHDNRRAVGVLVSIGTGKNLEMGPNPSAGYSLYMSYANRAAKWAADSEATHHNLYDTLRDNAAYFRLNVEHGIGKMKLDAWKGKKGVKTLELIRTKTNDYLGSVDGRRLIIDTARHLVDVRRARSRWHQDLDRWERFCHGVRYACGVRTCNHAERRWSRQGLRQHLEQVQPCNPTSMEIVLDEAKTWPQETLA